MVSWSVPDDPHPVRPHGDHLRADPGQDLLGRPPGLGLDQVRLVLVGEQVCRAVDQLADHLALAEGQLLARVGDERVAALAALPGVADHPLRVVGPDEHEGGLPDPLGDGLQLDQPGLAHRAGVEAGELRHRGVGRAHEPCGVQVLGDVDGVAVHAVALEPGAVVGEVLDPPHRPGPGVDPVGSARTRCCLRNRPAGCRGRRPGRRPRACRAARRPASRRTSRRSSSGGRWRWNRRSAATCASSNVSVV